MVKIPDALVKREFVFGMKGTPEQLVQMGETFLERGWLSDAVDVFARAGAKERLEELLAQVIEEGDAFLVGKLTAALDREPTDEEWRAVGTKAEEVGKYRQALSVYETLQDGTSQNRVNEKVAKEAPALVVSED